MKVWVLTYGANEYDQHGEYFEGVYEQRPTREQLMEADGMTAVYAERLAAGVSGRRGTDDFWWHLREVEVLR